MSDPPNDALTRDRSGSAGRRVQRNVPGATAESHAFRASSPTARLVTRVVGIQSCWPALQLMRAAGLFDVDGATQTGPICCPLDESFGLCIASELADISQRVLPPLRDRNGEELDTPSTIEHP
jgi:hypothetical protein